MDFCQFCQSWFNGIPIEHPDWPTVEGKPFIEYPEVCSLSCLVLGISYGKIHWEITLPLVRKEQPVEI
jgi:hypothetical protein